MSSSLGTLAITPNTPITFNAPNSGVKAIVISNYSGLTCQITMEGGGIQKNLHPSAADWFAVRYGFTGVIQISPSSIVQPSTPSFTAQTLVFDAIGKNDPEQAAMYPQQLTIPAFTPTATGQLLIATSPNFNGGLLAPAGVAGKIIYLKGFDLTASKATASAHGLMTITGLNTVVDPAQAGLNYELDVETAGAMPPLVREWATPLPGKVGQAVSFSSAALSDAVMALNIYYYIV